MSDLYRLDLMSKGLGIQDRTAIGASGQRRFYAVLTGLEDAIRYAEESIERELPLDPGL